MKLFRVCFFVFLNICTKILAILPNLVCTDAFVQNHLSQFPSIMTPVLDSVDAISCTCERVLSEMTSEPITGEHYNILEVQNTKRMELR